MEKNKLQLAQEKLKSIYGYDQFRDGQRGIIEKVLDGIDTIGIMPTGGGKSLCYQIPALVLPGVTLVISPLISLMKDQVDALNELNIPATYLNSTLSANEESTRQSRIIEGEYKLVYVAPERLNHPSFQHLLNQITLSLVAIDEAHCMSQWGHDFRPSYLSISSWLEEISQRVTVLALTATATKQVCFDLQQFLHIDEQNVITTGFERTNLTFQVKKGVNKQKFMTTFLASRKNESGIIYASTRKEVEQIYDELKSSGFDVACYHGGMSESQRSANQEAFIHDEAKIIVATNAFGMGIDKSNVRYILHYNLPRTVEAYYQEAGRAGRDGEASDCVLLFSPQDVRTQSFLIEQSDRSDDRQELEYKKLQQMTGFCHTERCLQQYILHYFGEDTNKTCGKCSNCVQTGEKVDRTKEAQMVFSTVKRVRERFGKTMIAQILVGSSNQKVKQLQLNNLSTYGLMKDWTQKDVAEFIDILMAEEYLRATGTSYPTIQLTEKTLAVLKGEEQLFVTETLAPKEPEEQDDVFEALRQLRKQLSTENNIPPYMVFSDRTLKEMSRYIPTTLDELAEISGVGEQKKEKYGEAFLDVLSQFKNSQPTGMSERTQKKSSRPSKKGQYLETAERFKNGEMIEQLVEDLSLTEQTIIKHLIRAEQEGIELRLAQYVKEEHRTLIHQVAEEVGTEFLKPIKEKLPEHITYQEIRFTLGK
ncbi:DNA helicase RecQ [Halalkalibacter okhensis]|uniref:DNA helicase RecQ n=1 Tax=Halalkalibacter okhensis TaxID=333138 RepID=A0A0B0IHV8_9BACI|nr:DNA helicase RecQ [Halalkalibacter okhensis]KHF40437.1 ATP-dependent DNA helicase [Halalkalibacter okhensis]